MPKRVYTDVDLNQNQILQGRFQNLPIAPTGPVEGQFYYNTASKKFFGWNGTDWIDLSQVVTNVMTLRGEISNAASNPAFPANPQIGDVWRITAQDGQVGTEVVEQGDELIYSTSGWFTVQHNLTMATSLIAGYILLATQAEVNAGSNTTKAVTPAALATFLTAYLFARKFRVVVNLTANTALPVVHGLGLLNVEDVQVSFMQNAQPITLAWTATGVNTISVLSNQTLNGVTVIAEG